MLVASGITIWITIQALVNIGAVTASLPITGVPLPLVSFGGSSLVLTMAGMGILTNIARQGRGVQRRDLEGKEAKLEVKVVIAGGGTAGHVNPAIALGRALENDSVTFIGTTRGAEARLVPAAGFRSRDDRGQRVRSLAAAVDLQGGGNRGRARWGPRARF